MKDQLRGCVRINAEGKNLYRFINRIHSGGICCFGQYCRKDVFYCEIYRSDLKKLEKFAQECSVTIKSAEYETLSAKLIRYRLRIGVIVGVILVLIGGLYFSNVVMSIEVEGNTTVSDEVVLSALSQLGIDRGAYIGGIDFHLCENKLRLMVDDISWAGVHRTGNRIVVQITEIVPKPEMVLERIPCNVVSAKDAEITYTSVYDGMLMHKVGDYVLQGTMLVSGVTSDDTGHVTIHHAMGVIKGIYEETVTFTEEADSEVYAPTGESRKCRYLTVFGAEIPLFFGRNKYESYVSEKNGGNLELFGKPLPIGFVSDKLTETKLTSAEYTDDELREKLSEKVYLYEKNFLGDVDILDRNITEEKKENSLTYTVRYRIEGDICEQREIFIK